MQMFFYGNMVSTNPTGAELLLRAGARLLYSHAVVEGYILTNMGQAPIAVRSVPLHGTAEYVVGEVWDVPDSAYLQMVAIEREMGFRESTCYWQGYENGVVQTMVDNLSMTARLITARPPEDFGYTALRDIPPTVLQQIAEYAGHGADFIREIHLYRWNPGTKTVSIRYNTETQALSVYPTQSNRGGAASTDPAVPEPSRVPTALESLEASSLGGARGGRIFMVESENSPSVAASWADSFQAEPMQIDEPEDAEIYNEHEEEDEE